MKIKTLLFISFLNIIGVLELYAQQCDPPVLAANQDTTTCIGEDLMITVTGDNMATFNWTISDPTNVNLESTTSGNGLGSTQNTISTNLPGEYTVTVTQENGQNCDEESEPLVFNIEFFNLPMVDAQNNGSICEDETLMLMETGGDAEMWDWTSNGNATIANANTENPTATDVTNGEIFTVIGTDSNGCSNSDTTIAIVYSNPPCEISGPSMVDANQQDVEYEGPPNLASYSWNILFGDAMITSQTDNSVEITFGTMTTLLQLTVTNNGCSTTCTKEIFINNVMCKIEGGEEVCAGDTVTYMGPMNANSYSWSVNSQASIVGASDQPDVTVAVGSNDFTISLDIGTSECELEVEVNPTPTLTGANSLCMNSTIQLSGSGMPAMNNPYISSDTAVALVDDTGLVTGAAPGTATIIYTDNNGCMDTKDLNVYSNPELLGDQTLCDGETAQFMGSGTPAMNNPYRSNFNSIASVTNTGLVTGESPGNAVITYTDSNGCRDTRTVIVYPLPNAQIIGVTEICEGDMQNLSSNQSFGNQWFENNTILTDSDFINLSDFEDGTYNFTLEVTDNNGCTGVTNESVIIKNVPKVQLFLEDASSGNQNDKKFVLTFEDNQPEPDSIVYNIYIGQDSITSLTQKDFNIEFIETFLLGINYTFYFQVYFDNSCVFNGEHDQKFSDAVCDNFNPILTIDGLDYNLNQSDSLNLCEVDTVQFELNFNTNNITAFNKLDYKRDDKMLSDIVPENIKDTIIIPMDSLSLIDFDFTYYYGAIGEKDTVNCTYILYITNNTQPQLKLIDSSFCYTDKDEIDLIFGSNTPNTTFKHAGVEKDSIVNIDLSDLQNQNGIYQLALTEISAKGNACPSYNAMFKYYFFRTPFIGSANSFCMDNEMKDLIVIDPLDQGATFTFNRVNPDQSLSPIDQVQSGLSLGMNTPISVYAAFKHTDSLTCYSDTIERNIEVNPLPPAEIISYIDSCGPFYTIDSMVLFNDLLSFDWQNAVEVIGDTIVTGNTNSNLVLEVISEQECINRDSISIEHNFEKSDSLLQFRTCREETLYYTNDLDENECYRWFSVNSFGEIQSIEGGTLPFMLFSNMDRPLLVKYNCNTPCEGTYLSNRADGSSDDCDEKDQILSSDWQIYPVPAFETLFLDSEFLNSGVHTIYIWDITGRLKDKITFSHGGDNLKMEINISQYRSGMYMLQLGDQTKKFIVAK